MFTSMGSMLTRTGFILVMAICMLNSALPVDSSHASVLQADRYIYRYLGPGQSLYSHPQETQTDRVVSANGTFTLIMQPDGNLVLYAVTDDNRTAVWASKTAGRAVARCSMQLDGNLVIYDYDNRPVWASGTSGNPRSYLEVQNDGNAVIYYHPINATGRRPVWATGTNARPR